MNRIEARIFSRNFSMVIAALVFALGSSCSKDSGTYDDLDAAGGVEKAVNRKYSAFFGRMKELARPRKDGPDSVLVKKAASATDKVIAGLRSFPNTLESRLALDALSYAARDLTVSPGFENRAVADFRDMALLNPIVVIGKEYIRSGKPNASTHVQLVQALRRGGGEKVSTPLFLDILAVIGTTPPPEVVSIAEKDTLAVRKAVNLILYARSRQPAPPPPWMVSGPWFAALRITGFYPMFFALTPIFVENECFLGLRTFEPGDVYAAVFRDPQPSDSKQYDAWLVRAAAAMDSFRVDGAFAERVKSSALPAWDAHYFFKDYLVSTDADSVRKEFSITLRRDKMFENAFHYAGADSMTIVFTSKQFGRSDGPVTTLAVRRVMEAAAYNGVAVPARSGTGTVSIMALGARDDSALRRVVGSGLSNVTVETVRP